MKFLYTTALLIVLQNVDAQSVVSWTQTKQVATNQYGNQHPRVVADRNGNPLILWGNANANRTYFSRWTGSNFTAPVHLNPDSIPVFAASWAGPDIAAHGDTVYVVFKEKPEDLNGIYLVRSVDGGVSFSAPVRVDAIADSISRFPAVSAGPDGNPLVAFMKFNPGWGNPQYVLTKSTDMGTTFGTDIRGSGISGGVVCDCCPASLTSSGNTTALVYRDNFNNLRNNWAGISFDNGDSFAGGMKIDDTGWVVNACPASGPDAVLVNDSLYSVFMSAAGGKTLCYRSKSGLSNLQMEFTEPLTTNFAGLEQQNFPRIAASGNAVAIVWKQNVNGSSQLAVQFTDNIANGFSSGYDVLAFSNVVNADVAFSDGMVHVVWEDQNTGTVRYKSGTFTVVGQEAQPVRPELVTLYPNPLAQSTLHLRTGTPDGAPVHYRIVTAPGQQMLAGEGHAAGGEIMIDVSGLSFGIYFVLLRFNDQTSVKTLIRQ